MNPPHPQDAPATRPPTLLVLAGEAGGERRDRITARGAAKLLRCVSSGYMSHGCRCRAAIPAAVVSGAWQREREGSGEQERFFHLAWSGGLWLAFGARDGSVRGVYCPQHRAEREGRSLTRAILAGEGELATA
jgi:hypothetical protein